MLEVLVLAIWGSADPKRLKGQCDESAPAGRRTEDNHRLERVPDSPPNHPGWDLSHPKGGG